MWTPASKPSASYRQRPARGLARGVAALVAVVVALSAPALASAKQAPTRWPSASTLGPTKARPNAADVGRTNFWPVGGLAAAIILGTCGLALWTERGRDDDDADDDDGWGRGGSDRPRSPRGPGGQEIDWAAFEADFRTYAQLHERLVELASVR